MTTFQDIQDRVNRRIIDLPAAVTAEVPVLINDAIRVIQDLHKFKVMEAETAQTQTTVASHTLLTVPSDWKELRATPYLVGNAGGTRALLWATDRKTVLGAFTLSDTNDSGEPKALLEGEPTNDQNARSIEVYPFPDALADHANGNYRIVIPYWKYVADLVATTDTNWFTDNATLFIVFQAAAEGFYLDWDENRGSLWETRAALQLQLAVKSDKMARLGGVESLAFSVDAHEPQFIGE